MHRSRIPSRTRRSLTATAAAASLFTLLTAASPAPTGDAAGAPAPGATSTPADGSRDAKTPDDPGDSEDTAGSKEAGDTKGTPASVDCRSQKPGLAHRLSRDISHALRGRHGTAAVSLADRRTGATCTSDSGRHFDSASIVKVTVLGALLKQADEAHRRLTPREIRLTTAMITKSDNASTSALWRQIGPRGVKGFLARAEMRHTVPGPGGKWGLTRTTAGDQLKLMNLLTAKHSPLSHTARAYALTLMRRVAPDQRWGVPAGAPRTATPHLKNGWLPRSTGGWRVHSIGTFTGKGHHYGLAVLTQGNPTMPYGITTIERVARVIHHDLNAVGPAKKP